jgi:lipopolysaccharide export LptBFGC system permease protein LptF
MVKRKITEGQTTQWPKEKSQKVRLLSDLLWFFFWPLCCLTFCDLCFDHCVVWPSVIFLLTIVLSGLLWFFFWPLCCGQTTQWSKEKSQKVRQHNAEKKNHRRSDNTMVKTQITEDQTTQWSKDKFVLSDLLWFFFSPLCCLTFCDFSFGHCVVW